MKKSEILLSLMEAVYEGSLPDDPPSLRECMSFYAELVQIERKCADKSISALFREAAIPEKKHAEKEPEPESGEISTVQEAQEEQEEPATEYADETASEPQGFHGKGSAEKRLIYDRLMDYRKTHGLGCFRKLADCTNGVMEAERIREMAYGAKATLTEWKVVGAAIDYLENAS